MQHAPGTFCFAERLGPDADAATRFYETVLGWSAVPGDEHGRVQVGGRDVAALRRTNTVPSRWVPYLRVDSADASADRARALRATIVAPPHDRPGVARSAIVQDPAGGVVGFWEPHGYEGAGLMDEPGSMWWAELLTRDIQTAKSFYSALFGWQPVDTLKYGIRYTVLKSGDEPIAGLLPIGVEPASSRWQILFAVSGCDETAQRAVAAGGSIVFGPNDVRKAGRAAVLADPGGAIFVVMQPAPSEGRPSK